MGSGMLDLRSVSMRKLCGMVSKKPVMSNISIVVAWSWFHAASMSCTMDRTVSCADLPVILPYWVDGNKQYLAARNASLLA